MEHGITTISKERMYMMKKLDWETEKEKDGQ